MATATPPTGRWLFGSASDLLLGCGLLYMALFGVFVAADELWVDTVPARSAPLCVLAFSLPHYGATLVRVYEHRTDRRAYVVFTVWISAALVLALVVGVYQHPARAPDGRSGAALGRSTPRDGSRVAGDAQEARSPGLRGVAAVREHRGP